VSEFDERPVFRDKRRIDPETGAVREVLVEPVTSPVGVVADEPVAEPLAESEVEADMVGSDLIALTEDLQRLSAEYANYRRRVERDRAAVRDVAVAGVIVELLPVLDDVGRAREHGELDGAFRAVGEALEQTIAKLGAERYAEPGEPFDPTIHEALTAVPSPEVDEPTVLEVYAPGYRYAGRIVRPARVVVAQPAAVDEPPLAAHP
jgi:molecular chaperone GrpE